MGFRKNELQDDIRFLRDWNWTGSCDAANSIVMIAYGARRKQVLPDTPDEIEMCKNVLVFLPEHRKESAALKEALRAIDAGAESFRKETGSEPIAFSDLILNSGIVAFVLLVVGMLVLYSYDRKKEITKNKYAEVSRMIKEQPALRDFVDEMFSDGEISISEFDQIVRKQGRLELEAAKSDLRD